MGAATNPKRFDYLSAAVFGVPLIVYVWTLEPSILWADSGIFATAATCYGIPNAPGFPGYLHIAHLFSLLPFGAPAWKVNLCSAFFGSGAVWMLFRTMRFLGVEAFAAAAGALSFAFCYGLWSQAINAETFAYTTFFILTSFYCLLRLDSSLPEAGSKKPAHLLGEPFRWFVSAVACLVAAGGGHPISSVALAPCAVLAYRRRAILAPNAARLASVGLVAASAFFLLYLSQMALAVRNPPLAFGDPRNLRALWVHVIAYYGGTAGLLGPIDPPRGLFPILFYLLEHSFTSLTPFAVPVVGYGALTLFRSSRRMFWMVASLPLAVWIANVVQITSNLEHTFLPAEAAFCVFAGFGLDAAAKQLAAKASPERRGLIGPALLILPALLLVRWAPSLDRSKQDYPEEFGRNVLEGLPLGSILVSRGDLVAAACDYLQIARGYRGDVAVLTTTVFLTQGWHRDQIHRRYPALDFRGLESSLAMNPLDPQRALAALIAENVALHPVFFMPTVSREMALPPGYHFEPHGLTVEVTKETPPLRAELWNLHFRDPEMWRHPPNTLELGYKMGWVGMLSQYAQGYENLRSAAAAKNDIALANRAATIENALYLSYGDDLAALIRRYPPRIPAGAPMGVQARP